MARYGAGLTETTANPISKKAPIGVALQNRIAEAVKALGGGVFIDPAATFDEVTYQAITHGRTSSEARDLAQALLELRVSHGNPGTGALNAMRVAALAKHQGESAEVIGTKGDLKINGQRVEVKMNLLIEGVRTSSSAMVSFLESQLESAADGEPCVISALTLRHGSDADAVTCTDIVLPGSDLVRLHQETSVQRGNGFVLSFGVNPDGSIRARNALRQEILEAGRVHSQHDLVARLLES